MAAQWTDAFDAEELAPGAARLVNLGPNRVAVFRVADGGLRAVDDRCPHEGYPLCQGSVEGEVLTCRFHNFKFDLGSGACLVGDEPVRTYPVRVVDGVVQLDVAPLDPATEIPRRWASLDAAVADERLGQIARDVVRLLALGVSPRDVARGAARWDAAHAEYGATHALPVAVDALVLAPEGLEAARALVPAFELAARGSARRQAHARIGPVLPGDPATFGARLSMQVEAEDLDGALGLLAGAVSAGWRREALEPALLRIASDHFLDIGHALIYATKVWAVVDGAAPDDVEVILSGLVRQVVYGTREDTLPAWTGWRKQTDAVSGRLVRWHHQSGRVADPDALQAALLDEGKRDALAAVIDVLDAGAAPAEVARELSRAAAQRFLRFDPRIDLDPAVQDTWLSVTHVQTFCHAVRAAIARWNDPLAVRLLLQGARFVAMTRPLDQPEDERPTWAQREATAADVIAAIRAQDPQAAVEGALGTDLPALRRALRDLVLDDPVVRPIFAAHAMKQTVVAFDDAESLASPWPVAALVRFLASPRQERRTARLVGEAIRLVRDGATPRVLAT